MADLDLERRPPLTPAQARALSIFRDAGPLSARAFASRAYPEAFGRSSATGRKGQGTLKGAGASLKAGAFLRRMFRDYLLDASVARETGLVTYRLSSAGAAALDDAVAALADDLEAAGVTSRRDTVTGSEVTP